MDMDVDSKDYFKVTPASVASRTMQGLRPTAHGECLIRHARTMLVSIHQARDELRALSSGSESTNPPSARRDIICGSSTLSLRSSAFFIARPPVYPLFA